MGKVRYTFFAVLFGCFCLQADPAAAQSFMYMDESGNIHFEEYFKNVPERYRNQIVPEKKSNLDHRGYKSAARDRNRMQKQFERQQRSAMKRTAHKNERQAKKELKRTKKQLRKGQKLAQPLPQQDAGMPTGADDAEFLE